MHIKKMGMGAAVVLAAAAFAVGQKPAPVAKTPAKVAEPLVRLDLLAAVRSGPTPFLRDLFLPQGPGSEGLAAMPAVLGDPVRPGLVPGGENPADEAAPPPVLRYVGFVRSQGRFLALVLIDGQAVALAEGEAAGAVGRIVKITAGEIEVQGADGKSQKFALEGERK
jgi:hypothetical protein